jgi:type IV pilus assembly protein PilV
VKAATLQSNSLGFSLIEVVVALAILMVGMMALLATAGSVVSYNLDNMLRDEAVQIADSRLREVKANRSATFASPFTNISTSITRKSKLRSKSLSYGVTLSAAATGGDNSNLITVNVTWPYQNKTKQHELKTFISNY